MLQLFPECYADTALIQFLINDPLDVVHIYGIPNVAKELKEANDFNKPGRFIGVVDKDKRNPPYLLTFDTIHETNKVCFKRKNSLPHYLIIIDKAIESFLLWNAAQVSINIIDYDFPDEVKALGKVLKTSAIGSNPDYLRLLTDLHAKQAPGILTLERLLNDLITT
ncbi:hypothetical protein [Fibrella aquatilis]|uniref:Uncharacterized protein n=1 Tax=Fibrella aquatilis TaxID=2817059 RepID=A0A939G4Z6_9BACT|nr:hypothetical protein [Fibrella aquatilis]MBO0931288.1 hypothetical protein [Fibrella aquatilis]